MIRFFMLKLHQGGYMSPTPTPKFELPIAQEGRVYKIEVWCTKLNKMSTKLWSSFLYSNCIWEDACLPPLTPKFEFRLVEGGCTKFGTWCTKLYKMSTRLWSSFLCWSCIWGMHVSNPHSKIWIADSARRKNVLNFGRCVQNCTKWVQNYDPVFYLETAFRGGGLHVTRPQIWIADSARRNGVQNCTK